jgi:hypothetical protein
VDDYVCFFEFLCNFAPKDNHPVNNNKHDETSLFPNSHVGRALSSHEQSGGYGARSLAEN